MSDETSYGNGRAGWLAIRGEDGSMMTWPDPTDPGEIEQKLRYAPDSLTRGDQLSLASLVAAYGHLVHLDSRTRQLRVMQIRAAVAGTDQETR